MEKLEQLAQRVLVAAKELGAQFAQCVVKETETHEFNMLGNEFSLMRTLFGQNV